MADEGEDTSPPQIGLTLEDGEEMVEVPLSYLQNANWYYENYFIEKARADEYMAKSDALDLQYAVLNNTVSAQTDAINAFTVQLTKFGGAIVVSSIIFVVVDNVFDYCMEAYFQSRAD